MKNVAILGENPNFFSALIDTESAYNRSGKNVGNHAFWNAVSSHISNPKTYINTWSFDSDHLKNNFDLLVIPASNFIHPNRDLGALADKLRKSELPLLVLGIGAQASSTNSNIQLKEGTVSFLSVLSQQALHVTCRGEFTANILKNYGINNSSPLGCPSNLINLSSSLGRDLEKSFYNLLKKEQSLRILVNLDLHRRKYHNIYLKLLKLVKTNYTAAIIQNPIDLVKLARGDSYDANSPHIEYQRKLWASVYPDIPFSKLSAEKFFTFFNANHCMELARKFDLSLGTRLHGNMLALQAGTPTIFFSHDSRTSELVKIMKLPECNFNDFNFKSQLELIKSVNFNGAEYDQNRLNVANKYISILEACNLTPTPQLKRFVSGN